MRAVRARFGLGDVPIRLLTNATMLHRERVRAALPGVDEVWGKLDAGTEAYFQKVDGTTPVPRVLANLAETAAAREPPILIQSMFCAFDGVGPDDAEIDAWLGRLDTIAAAGRIDHVQIYTVARRPSDTTVGPLPTARLEAIRSGCARAAGLRRQRLRLTGRPATQGRCARRAPALRASRGRSLPTVPHRRPIRTGNAPPHGTAAPAGCSSRGRTHRE